MIQSLLTIAILLLSNAAYSSTGPCSKKLPVGELERLKASAEKSKSTESGKSFKDQYISSIGQNLSVAIKACSESLPGITYPSRLDIIVEFDKSGSSTKRVLANSDALCDCVLEKIPDLQRSPPQAPFFVHLGITINSKE